MFPLVDLLGFVVVIVYLGECGFGVTLQLISFIHTHWYSLIFSGDER